jgi:hypothetical protein
MQSRSRGRCVRLQLKTAHAKALPLFDYVHANFEFEALRGDPAFEALFKP